MTRTARRTGPRKTSPLRAGSDGRKVHDGPTKGIGGPADPALEGHAFDPVESALALGLVEASKALARGEPGKLEVICALTAELTARREALAAVLTLRVQRAKRRR